MGNRIRKIECTHCSAAKYCGTVISSIKLCKSIHKESDSMKTNLILNYNESSMIDEVSLLINFTVMPSCKEGVVKVNEAVRDASHGQWGVHWDEDTKEMVLNDLPFVIDIEGPSYSVFIDYENKQLKVYTTRKVFELKKQ